MYGILVIGFNEFSKMSVCQFERPLNEKRIAMKAITGYEWDNNHQVIEHRATLFAFSVSRSQAKWGSIEDKRIKEKFGKDTWPDKVYSVHIWNTSGCQSIFSDEFLIKEYDETIPPDLIDRIDKALVHYEEGKVSCCDCGKETSARSGRNYFAATYCPGCWEGTTGQQKGKGGWREVEARETYD